MQMKYIDLPKGKKALLRRTFSTTGVTVWSALNFMTHSELARRIRAAAMAQGGVVRNTITTPEGFMPNCQTAYVHREDGTVGRIIQTFSNDVRVEFDADRATAEILHGAQRVKIHTGVALRDWGTLVFEAQRLAESLDE